MRFMRMRVPMVSALELLLAKAQSGVRMRMFSRYFSAWQATFELLWTIQYTFSSRARVLTRITACSFYLRE